MLKKILTHLKNNKLYYLTFITGLIIVTIIYILQKVAPFGRNSMLTIDFFHQYGPMLGELYDRLTSGSNLIYSFTMGMGLPFIRNYMNYLSSPFNFLLLLFKRENIVMAYSLIIGLKAICSATTMVFYLSKKFNTKSLFLIPFGCLFGFCAYFTAYYWNIMWLDGLVMLPLIIYGIEKLVEQKKPLFYIFSLAIMLVSNYFIGFMLCIFSVIYFIAYLILKTEKIKIKEILKKCLLFGASSMFAGGLVAVLLVPLFLGISSISATSDVWPTSQYYAFTFWEYLANHFSGVGSTVLSSGITNAANISCGILSIALLLLFIINSKIKFKVKAIYLSLLLFMVISFFYAPLDFIWHAFHVPNDLPYRYSFIYSFILIVIGAYSLINIKHLKAKTVGAVFVLTLMLIGLLKIFNYENISNEMLLLNCILIVIYFVLYLLYKNYPSLKKMIPAVFILTIILECTITINNNWQILQYVDEFYADYNSTRDALDFISYNDSNFYRVERTSVLTFNDPSWYNYYGQTTFSSMAYENMAILHTFLGLPGNNINSYYYKQTTPIYDLMFNIKYFFGTSWDINRYTLFYQQGNDIVFKNNFNAGLMFAVNKDVNNWQFIGDNPFAIQNDFIEKTTGIKDVFSELKPSSSNIIYDNGTKIVKYTYDNPGDNMYFYTSDYNVDFIIVNDTLYYLSDNFDYFSESNEEINVFDYVDYNEKYIINTRSEDATYDIYVGYSDYHYDSSYGYTINNDNYEAAAWLLQGNKVQINTFKEHIIKGQIEVNEPKTIFTSVPYDNGWSVWVDNKKVETFKIANALLGFNIPAGDHNVTLKYSSKGLLLGGAISACSLLTIGIYLFYKNKKVHY